MRKQTISDAAKGLFSNPSRRSMLAHVSPAAVGTVALVASALPAEADPIFAAIEKHREAEAEFVKACAPQAHGKEADRLRDHLFEIESEARAELIKTVPQTRPGMRGMLQHLRDYFEKDGGLLSHDDELVILLRSLTASPALAGGRNV
jgi:hypothetical protein